MTPGPGPWPALDWQAPWYAPWRAVGETAEAAVLGGQPVHESLNATTAGAGLNRLRAASSLPLAGGVAPADACTAPSASVTFVPQAALPGGLPYEGYIRQTGEVPTREGLHDFFNGLCWQRFPRTKRRLNQLQADEIARRGVGAVRGPVRDAITVFDENGALLQAPEPLWRALRERQWQRLFVDLRPLWAQARLVVFGHALLEKLAAPRKDMTAHVWQADAPLADGLALEAADAWLAAACTAEALAAKPFTPLPVLGVPGWWPANEDMAFYGDARVFRLPRIRQNP